MQISIRLRRLIALCLVLAPALCLEVRATQTSCDCRAALETLIEKVEANYVGYHLGVLKVKDASYERHKASLRGLAAKTSDAECISVLQQFLLFFRDGHLFAGNQPKLSEAELVQLRNSAPRFDKSEAEVREYLARSGKLDPIEGIWYSADGYRVGIMKDPRTRRFVAVMFSNNIAGWQPGQIKAVFTKLRDGSYDVVIYADNHTTRHPSLYDRKYSGGAVLRKENLLHMPPYTWGREFPVSGDALDPVDPRKPTVKLVNDDTIAFSIPSLAPQYRQDLNKLVDQQRERLQRAATLIIDLRGNEGGSSSTLAALAPFVVTAQQRPARVGQDSEASVVSSPDNIHYFEQMVSQGWIPKRLIERLKENAGKVIPFTDPGTGDSGAGPQMTATDNPRNVAILIDGGVVSAGEAAVLNAMRFTKVTLFGANTGGMIDYQNVTIVRLPGCDAAGYYLGYPTLASSSRLPLGALNPTGIAPDVRIEPAVKDPFKFILDYYKTRRR